MELKVEVDKNGHVQIYSIIKWPKPPGKTRHRVLKLREQGYSHVEISKRLEYFERKALYEWLIQHPDLSEIYHFKEAMHGLYRIKGYNQAY